MRGWRCLAIVVFAHAGQIPAGVDFVCGGLVAVQAIAAWSHGATAQAAMETVTRLMAIVANVGKHVPMLPSAPPAPEDRGSD